MAKPRVFISSTYYDLKHVRSDVERFVRELGYEAVANERGHIAYGTEEKLEVYCYKELESCDIIVSIVSSRFGTKSQVDDGSISHVELKTAAKLGKQIYVFVDRNVLAEYETYLINKDNKDVKYRHVDSVEIFKFIEKVYALPRNNNIHGFDSSGDIITYLREQWAGLFQRLLQERIRLEEVQVVSDLKRTAESLGSLIGYLRDEKEKGNAVVHEILMSIHPAFSRVAKLLGIGYRVYFTNIAELEKLLRARKYSDVSYDEWDSPEYLEWMTAVEDGKRKIFKVWSGIFDNGSLKIFTNDQWDDSWIQIEDFYVSEIIYSAEEEEIPF